MNSVALFLGLLLVTSVPATSNIYQQCMSIASCRELHSQSKAPDSLVASGVAPSEERFAHEIRGLETSMRILLGPLDKSLAAEERRALYEVMLLKALMDESKCPPNSYWRWNPETNEGGCQCYIDRDCRSSTTAVCQDNIHPGLYWIGIILATLLVADIITRLVTDRFTR